MLAMLVIMATASYSCALGASDGGSLFFLTNGNSAGSSSSTSGTIAPCSEGLTSSVSVEANTLSRLRARSANRHDAAECAFTEWLDGSDLQLLDFLAKRQLPQFTSANCIDTTHRRE